MKASSKFIKISAGVWILSIILFITSIAFATGGFKSTVQNTDFGNSTLFLILLLGSIGIGSLAFGLLVLGIFIRIILEKQVLKFEKSFKGIIIFGIKLFFLLAILPLFLLYRISGLGGLVRNFKKERFRLIFLKSKGIKPFLARLVGIVAISLTFLPLWIGGYWIVGTVAVNVVTYQLGYVPEDMTIVGTGSMYPTWPKGTKGKTPKELVKEVVGTAGMFKYPNGIVIAGNRILGHKIGRGDIVVVEDDKTRKVTQELYGYPSGVLKRIVAIGGDTLELKDGIVYLNDQPLKEPYIAKARSTFGQTFLKECSKVTVPENSIFVMGDNRKGSGDSREDGFFSINDIKYVLPLKSQKGDLVKNWRDTSKDFDVSSKIKLDKEKLLELLNSKRKEAGLRPIKYQPKLEQSAYKRGEVMLKYDDFSYEATRSGYPIERAMRDVGYSNVVWNEGIIQGNFEAEELMEYFFEFPDWKKNLFLNKDLQEVGVAEVEKADGCSTHAVVMHFAGYIPPNYKQEDIESWRRTINNLDSVIPSWEISKGSSHVNQEELTRLLNLFYRERVIASNILSKMESNKWLTKEEEALISEFNRISQESINLSDKLNRK